MTRIILSPSGGPGLPEGSPEHRYELELVLDGQGLPSAEAWLGDTNPWPARRQWPGQGVMEGDVQYDPDLGWALRFFHPSDRADDAPLHAVMQVRTWLRPGENVTIVEPNGKEHGWRVVSIA
ncbi:hypothetical protein LPC08_23180 [Roseomonas sp. OT10]|uniref:hypothetical protein n=1 Tax=Roseomonas cutis TaxID=2897332 RepID=UPI001E3F9239|nr:hypothetical protein [Roseomonas sp. OT10]UFN48869.1 hypothetical protein LPC08_23180 [Roseomonas sp. OT10]